MNKDPLQKKLAENEVMKQSRMTKVRMAIIKIIKSSDYPLSAMEVKQQLSEIGVEPNKATIYRQISFLAEAGVIREVRLKDESMRYEFVTDEHIHHLICDQCHSVTNIKLKEDIDHLEQQIKREKNFDVKQHTLEFYGLCADCSPER